MPSMLGEQNLIVDMRIDILFSKTIGSQYFAEIVAMHSASILSYIRPRDIALPSYNLFSYVFT
jgi:hypothetical protein